MRRTRPTRSPLLYPARPRRRPKARERLLGLLIAVAALIETGSTPRRRGPLAAVSGVANLAAVSPAGLPLGIPPLALLGLASPTEDPLHPRLPNQPAAGLPFNVETGQIH